MKFKNALALLFIFAFHIAKSQDPYAILLNKASGMPSIAVYQNFQDSKGFIWLASDAGLTKYDGFQFETFNSPEQTAFPGSCIQEDRLGRIWYENFDGYLYYVEPNSQEIKALNHGKSIGYMPYGVSEQYVFVVNVNGIQVFDIETLKKIKTIKLSVSDPQHTICVNNNFYFIEENKLHIIDSKLQVKSNKLDFKEKTPKQIYQLNNNTLLVVAKYNVDKKLHLYTTSGKKIKSLDIADVPVIHNINMIDKRIWISSPNGVFIYNVDGELSNHYFSGNSISSVMKDRQSNYWFSSTNQGVFLVSNPENKYYFKNNTLPNRIVKISYDSYVIATKNGQLFEVDIDFKIKRSLNPNQNQGEIFYLHFDPINQILSYSANGFFQIDMRTGKIQLTSSYSIKEITPLDDKFMAFAASNSSGLLIKNKSLISYWDKLKSDFSEIDLNYRSIFLNNRARSVVYDVDRKIIYFATNTGLFAVTQSEKKELQYKGETFYASRLLMHKNKLFALSTKGNLYQIEAGGKFELLNTQYGVGEFDIRFCKLFESKLVFVNGSFIHQVDLETQQHSIYNLNISNYDINDILVDGKQLLLLVNDGIIQTEIGKNEPKNIKPLFRINRIQSKELEFDKDAKIQVSHKYNQLSVGYSILDFGNSIPETLYYNINNGAWQATSQKSRTLTFPMLEPGSYTVAFKLGDELLNEKISFKIDKPWWKQLWFILLSITAISCLAYVFYRNRVNALSRQNILLEENIRLEKNLRNSVLTTIKSQMNPHFLYNALNTIQAYIYTNDKENAGKYLLKFSKLTRRVLEMSEKEAIDLNEEIETIKLYLELEHARFSDDFNYQIDLSNVQHIEKIKVPPMLIQPYIENAIKHGLLHKNGQKELRIFFIEENDYLVVKIDDNGIGRKRSTELNQNRNKQHQSFASEANSKRLEVLNYGKINKVSVEIEDKMDNYNMPTGTLVTLHIPIQN